MFRRAQAAMEYLMTYGWAILAIVIVLGALLYLGVFSLASKAPDFCRPQVGMHCTSWRLDASDDNATVLIINGYQQHMNVTQVLCQVEGTSGTWTVYPNGIPVAPQLERWISISGCYDMQSQKIDFDEGEQFGGKVVVQFYFLTESPDSIRRNSFDVKFTAQP
ncbi:MAG: hypothetical protein ABIF01_03940 [Candidatus Micrarchaeota archaeon]